MGNRMEMRAMTVRHDEALVTAAHAVHDEVWYRHWREGKTELRPTQVIDAIGEVRVKARIDEVALPEELQRLLKEARDTKGEHGMIRLVRLIESLKQVFLPPRPERPDRNLF